jgi:periplasmic divalent cation tolerance protein
VLLMIKTRADLIDKDLVPIVQELHPCQVPEIIALPVVGGGQSYLDWIFSETTRI